MALLVATHMEHELMLDVANMRSERGIPSPATSYTTAYVLRRKSL